MTRKIYIILLSVLTAVFAVTGAFAYKFEFVTVSDVVKSIQGKFASLETYQAKFVITSERLEKKKVQQGTISYKAPGKLLLNFTSPAGQKIVCSDSTLWIYIPSLNVVAEQDLKDEGGLFAAQTQNGLKRLFSRYHYKFDGKEQPEVQKDGSKLYTLFLKQKESRSGYRTLKLWVTEDYMIVRAAGETASGKKVDISFSQIRTDLNLPGGMFKFDIPGQARVVKNPMIAEEE